MTLTEAVRRQCIEAAKDRVVKLSAVAVDDYQAGATLVHSMHGLILALRDLAELEKGEPR